MKPHRTDPVSLLAGLACLGLVGLWLTAYVGSMSAETVAGMAAIGLLLLVAVGLACGIVAGRRSR